MNGRDILERIVAENGNCTAFANGDTCLRCPMSKLKKQPNGNYYGCVEALGIHNLPAEEHDSVYKEKAQRMLLDLDIEDMLTK
jgi:hypothetical protein